MQILIEQASLLRLVDAARRISPTRTTKPILTHLLLEPGDNLIVTGTDEELSYVGSTPAQVEAKGRVAVPAKDLYDIVRTLPKGQVVSLRCDPTETMLEVECSTIQFSLNTLPADDFPNVTTTSSSKDAVTLPSRDLSKLLEQALYAVSQEETRYYLGGVYLEQTTDGDWPTIRAVATDGHRLALSQQSRKGEQRLPWEGGRILPSRLLRELLQALPKNIPTLPVTLEYENNRVSFTVGDDQILSGMLVEGSFPDYKMVIPRKTVCDCVVNRESLSQALTRISLMSPEKTAGVRVTLEKGKLTLSSQSTGRGKGKESLEVKSDGAVEAGFNAQFLREALGSFSEPEVRLSFVDHLSPITIRAELSPEDMEDNAPSMGPQMAVVMPMRL